MKNILIVGAGYMAQEYFNYLVTTNNFLTVIGRKKKKIKFNQKKYKNVSMSYGGIEKSKIDFKQFSHAIVAVNEKYCLSVVSLLIKNKIQNILIEKPGAKNIHELKKLQKIESRSKSKIYIAYNRRFYESVKFVKDLVKKDKGITSTTFSFTEWIDKIKSAKFEKYLMKKWFYFNSLHLIDLIFYLIGDPKLIFSKSDKKNKNFTKSLYLGFGISKKNIHFSYHSNWESAGRWEILLYTKKRKVILSPLEKVQIQNRNSAKIEFLKFNSMRDEKFKPGIPGMIDSFLSSKKDLMKLKEYIQKFIVYNKIAGYNF